MSKLLVHVTCGPNDPTRAALAFFVAAAATDAGHEVHVFLAGDGVQLVRESVLNNLHGLGTGALREHFDKALAGGARIYLSGNSCAARGLGETDLAHVAHEKVGPPRLVELVMECDRNIVY
jgi:uncharacterized protein